MRRQFSTVYVKFCVGYFSLMQRHFANIVDLFLNQYLTLSKFAY